MHPPLSAQPSYARRSVVSEAVDQALIRCVVEDFYAAARGDSLLGPVFEAHVNDWESHLKRMCGFWSAVLLGDGQYAGNPIAKHEPVTELTAEHFKRWLELFSKTLETHCCAADRQAWEAAARRMGFAMSFRLGHGEHPELLT